MSNEQIKKLLRHLKVQVERFEPVGRQRLFVNYMIVDVLLNSGLRAAEFCQLRIKDLPYYHGKAVIDVREGKGCKQRSVQISLGLVERINQYIKRYRKNAKPNSFLFVSERGGPTSYRAIYSKLRIIGRSAGIVRLTPHMLRHTYSMVLYEISKDTFGLQDQLGHRNPQTTHIYAKTSNVQMSQQLEKMERHLQNL